MPTTTDFTPSLAFGSPLKLRTPHGIKTVRASSFSFDRHSTSRASRPQLQAIHKSVNTGASLKLSPNCAHRCARDVAEMITSLPQWLAEILTLRTHAI